MKFRIILAWTLLTGSLIGWPCSVFWWAKDEPVFVLSLSWIALAMTAVDILFTAEVKEKGTNE